MISSQIYRKSKRQRILKERNAYILLGSRFQTLKKTV
ncbi:hypothetical protein PI23P_08500 [Polaribacter irgensii 23-P]|uniref:Uncharacterized protein n=1 Tax=Polaribacter irgensii 23-P TaxID=313594 RepID=A4BZQ9_9FLAO|nr:hypothetical protein PI23P_08500 [Polaribacter irgensii 23-P]